MDLNQQSEEDGAQNNGTKYLGNLALNTNKAGMEGLDSAKINEIIQKSSEGSRFYQHKEKLQEKLNKRISDMLETAMSYSEEQKAKASQQMEREASLCQSQRDLSRTIVHVDMDMFYAAVEMRDNPKLKTLPMAVGSKSMLSTSNYIARKFGVRAAMPGFIAMKLCPNLVLVPPNFSKYKSVSKDVEEVFSLYDPNYVMMSLDEAYLDITDFILANMENYEPENDETVAEVVVREMRRKIEEKTQLTASAGIAANTRLSKVCSDLNKPNGQYYLQPQVDVIMDFVRDLPIRKISGIGNVMEQQLKALGILKCGDIAASYGLLKLLFSDTSHHYFLRISLGLGETDLSNMGSGERKSISTETTFSGTSDRNQLTQIVHDLCADLHKDMSSRNIVGKLVTLKTKSTDFVLKTRSMGLAEATNDAQVIEGIARKILHQEMESCSSSKPLSLRLLGVRLSTLYDSNAIKSKQLTLNSLFTNSSIDLSNKVIDETQTNSVEKCDIKKPSEIVMYVCPICNKPVDTKFLSVFNKHIDNCLEAMNGEDISNGEKSATENISNARTLNPMADENLDSETKITNKFKHRKIRISLSDSDDESVSGPENVVNKYESKLDKKNESADKLEESSNSEKITDASTSKAGESSHSFFLSKMAKNNTSKEKCSKLGTAEDSEHIAQPNLTQNQYVCPVCCKQSFTDNILLNKHLDECLSGDIIKDIRNGSHKANTATKRKKSTDLEDVKKNKKMKNSSIVNYFS